MNYEHLLGIPFEHGVNDCYEIVRRFYADNFDIQLRPYARPDGWWDQGLNLYIDNFRNEGFELVDDPPYQAKPADVFLVTIKSVVPNHAGIYLGDNKVLHHYLNRLSEVMPFRTMWRSPCAILRHKDVVIQPEQPIHIADLVLPHKRALFKDAGHSS